MDLDETLHHLAKQPAAVMDMAELALLLARDGHRVEVFERAPELGPVGAGFLLQPTGLQVLWELELLPEVMAHGRRVNRLYGETPCGRAVMDMRYAGLDARLFGLGGPLMAEAGVELAQVAERAVERRRGVGDHQRARLLDHGNRAERELGAQHPHAVAQVEALGEEDADRAELGVR